MVALDVSYRLYPALNAKIKERDNQTSGGVSRGGRQRRNTERVTDMGQLELLTI